eukprot:TRINITY_DN15185_c0_g1_i1.p1 TRINITY_DN15185_c0_g1~~TRINITY_DN15185_c0_g1_i1.p1  ORF type:complete len:328 (+),score=57.82 TRINITY_DN15185_c0_g1_i1:45-1028(+)
MTTIPKPYPTRKLGKNGPEVAAIGFGAMGLNAFYGKPTDDPQVVLAKTLELGSNFWDTADIYKDNEEELSKILATRRNEVFLATKFAVTPSGISGKPEYIREAIDRSLQRLGVDQVDLYYQHRIDPNTPIEDSMGALSDLVKQGKIKYIGLSECSAQTLRRACKVHHVAAVQVEYSPWTLDIENNGLLEACRELGVAIVAYSPLGRGFLAGRFKSAEDFDGDDWRRTNPRFAGENFQKNLDLVKELERFAAAKGCTSGQLCLAWILAQGEDFIPIPGTTSVKNLEQNLASVSVTITKEDNEAIREVLKKIPVIGTRYPEAGMAGLNQ